MANQWFVRLKARELGPLSSAQLKHLADSGKISPSTEVRRANDNNWVRAGKVKGLFSAAEPTSETPPSIQEGIAGVPVPPPLPSAARVVGDSPDAQNARVEPESRGEIGPRKDTPLPDHVAASSQVQRSRIVTGSLLLATCLLTGFWFFFIEEDFYEGAGLLRRTYLLIALLSGALGIFLVAGGQSAAAFYSAIGLAEPPRRKTKRGEKSTALEKNLHHLLSLLAVSAVWHLGIGWLVIPELGQGDEGRQAAFGVLFWGIVPAVLAPYCARTKKVALWITFAVWTVWFLMGLVVSIPVLFRRPSPRAELVLTGGFLYGVASGLIALLAGICLFHLRAGRTGRVTEPVRSTERE